MAHRATKALVAGGLAVAATRLARPRANRWGATDEEWNAVLPGDDAVTGCRTTFTRAVTVHAPPSAVWPWLVQMGQDRAGLYTYDWLENLAGLHFHNADRIVDEWQDLAVGRSIRLVPQGWPLFPAGLSLPVVALEPERDLVLETTPAGIWSFHLRPVGSSSTRLVSRGRSPAPVGFFDGLFDGTVGAAYDLVVFVMERGMLLGIKERAERPAPPRLAAVTSEPAA